MIGQPLLYVCVALCVSTGAMQRTDTQSIVHTDRLRFCLKRARIPEEIACISPISHQSPQRDLEILARLFLHFLNLLVHSLRVGLAQLLPRPWFVSDGSDR